jgi:hypothetical protein
MREIRQAFCHLGLVTGSRRGGSGPPDDPILEGGRAVVAPSLTTVELTADAGEEAREGRRGAGQLGCQVQEFRVGQTGEVRTGGREVIQNEDLV